MIRRPSRSTRPATLLPSTALFRSDRRPERRVVGFRLSIRPTPDRQDRAAQRGRRVIAAAQPLDRTDRQPPGNVIAHRPVAGHYALRPGEEKALRQPRQLRAVGIGLARAVASGRSEEHTSELQSLMRISYAVFCLKKKNSRITLTNRKIHAHSLIPDTNLQDLTSII